VTEIEVTELTGSTAEERVNGDARRLSHCVLVEPKQAAFYRDCLHRAQRGVVESEGRDRKRLTRGRPALAIPAPRLNPYAGLQPACKQAAA